MQTNNSSIISKRSVERLYLPEPHFFRYFVRKPLRRSPTINRGYWLRMRAVEHIVREFLERPTDQRKIVVNLGCGYDPLPFQWLAREPELCRNVRFVDVDYKALMLTKTEIIESTPRMRDLLTPQVLPADGYTVLNANEYIAIGCDLRDIAGLSATIGSLTKEDACLVLCVAEVSITYMNPDAADAVIEWAANLSSGKSF
jgi:tRNA wybutosine-synthesizing protein 4